MSLLDRDELWALVEGKAEVTIPVSTYRKLVAAYDYWLSRPVVDESAYADACSCPCPCAESGAYDALDFCGSCPKESSCPVHGRASDG